MNCESQMTTSSHTNAQQAPLLTTKLYVPVLHPNLVPRPRLIQRLDEGRSSGHRLTLISAPAGFGKTALVTEWLQHLRSASTQGRDVCACAWLSLDDDDNDPRRFFTYLVAALEGIRPDVGANSRALLQSPQPPPLKAALTLLINSLATIAANFVLVLDDYHVIAQQAIHDALTFLLENQPPQMHLVIASRVDPPLPLPRLRTRSQLTELRATDLRFTPDEAAAFLNQAMGLNLSAEDVEVLEARTEGWIAGLQMAALSMQGKPAEHVADFIAAFSGSHRHVIDYLAEEVLARQPDGIRDFLCQTAILDRLAAPLCDAVTGRDDSEVMLRHLEQANLFLLPLDEQRKWYRYHRLFADFLRNHLRQHMPDLVRDLHAWAADWYEQNGFPADAVGHALQATDYEWAARLIERAAPLNLMHGQVTSLLAWLRALPDELIRSRPQLGIYYVWALLIASEMDNVEAYLDDIEQQMRIGIRTSDATSANTAVGHPVQELLGQVAAARAYLAIYQGNPSRAIQFARQASEQLSREDPFLRSIATWLLGLVLYIEADADIATRTFAETTALGQEAGSIFVTMLSAYTSGYLQTMQGHLQQARELFSRSLQLEETGRQHPGAEQPHPPTPAISLIYQGLGYVSYEQNDLQDAERYLAKCIEIAEAWGNAEVLADSYIFLARVKQAQGDARGANGLIGKAEQLARENRVAPMTVRLVHAHRARLWIAQANPDAAARWAASLAPIDTAEEKKDNGQIHLYMGQIEQCTSSRLFIAQGQFREAERVLQPLLQPIEEAGWMGLLIEIQALLALALHGQGKVDEALDVLQSALTLAEPGGYVRVFVDLDASMAELLQQAVGRSISRDYAKRLLAAFPTSGFRSQVARAGLGATPTSTPGPVTVEPETVLIEQLSERELEVLRLIAEGLTNREIAERLFIAVSTVKTHINNIYRKLDASNRAQAVTRVSELNLL